MYGFVNDNTIPLTIENILLRVSQEDIFSVIMGKRPQLNKNYHSIIRSDDNNPNCNFIWFGDKLLFLDFGYHKTHLDCFGIISEKTGKSLIESLSLVNRHFKLGLNGEGEPAKIKFPPLQNKNVVKPTTNIVFKPRSFNSNDEKYWSQYGITKQNLIDENVYAIIWYKFYSFKLKRVVVVRPKTITYAYYEFFPKVKIYSPYSQKNNGKWVSNLDSNHIGGLRTLPIYGNKLVITKSLKDAIVIKNFKVNTTWLQSEGVMPNTETLLNLLNRFDEYIVLYDNDKKGLESSIYLTAVLNSHYPNKARNVIIPVYPNVTDSSDFYKEKGKIELLKLLVINNII